MDPKSDQNSPKTISSCNGINDSACSSFLSLTLYFLSFSFFLAIIRGRGDDLCNAVYVLSFYLCAMLMLICAHCYHRSPEDSARKERLKAPLLILTTVVNCLFVHGVSEFFTPVMAWFIWIMVGSIFLLGFYFFFINPHKSSESGSGAHGLVAEAC